MPGWLRIDFDIRDRVHIDGCKDLVGVVTAITCRPSYVINYEVSWVAGEAKSAIIEGWRLSLVEGETLKWMKNSEREVKLT